MLHARWSVLHKRRPFVVINIRVTELFGLFCSIKFPILPPPPQPLATLQAQLQQSGRAVQVQLVDLWTRYHQVGGQGVNYELGVLHIICS